MTSSSLGSTKPLAPWGITVNTTRDPLTMRHTPPTMRKSSSMPGFQNRNNEAARGVGSRMAGPGTRGDFGRASTGQLGQGMAEGQQGMGDYQQGMGDYQQGMGDYQHGGGYDAGGSEFAPGGNRLRRKVDNANDDAQRGRMPTEAEILNDQFEQD